MAETLIEPPIRTALLNNPDGTPLNQIGASNGNASSSGGEITIQKHWYRFWGACGAQINANTAKLNNLVTFGAHANRPDPANMPNGALYVESDRGSVYYNNGGVWQYIAGTMWGTLSPDQRPTDLGVNDAGFDYRTTDQPAREFIWSQAYWVEATPVRFGTHAARLAVDVTRVIEQMLWVETDRGVLYQLMLVTGTTPVWQYIAGTMWGTMSPDQRPTDLGTHDAGFDYRSTDAPPREFIWSQAAWVEVTPAPQTPWTSNINGAGFQLYNAGSIGVATTPVYPLDVLGYAGSSYSGGTARFSGGPAVSEAGIHIVNTGTGGQDYAIWSTGGASGLGDGNFFIADSTVGAVRFLITAAGNVGLGGLTSASYQLQLSADSAAKPGTNTWTIASDIRTKRNVQRFEGDIEVIRRLDPIVAEYNGLGGTPEGARVVSFDAEKLRAIVPQCVSSTRGKLRDGDEETDILCINTHELFFHLLRAVQQIDRRVQALETP